MAQDFIPTNWAAFAEWSQNFNKQLPGLAAKYGISAAKLAQTDADNNWVQYWTQARVAAKAQEKQLSDYTGEIANGALNAPAPSEPTWAMPAGAPPEVPPGVKKRDREIAAGIKAQKSIYTQADGELLGIVTPEESGLDPINTAPELKLRSMPNFALEADFRKYGMDMIHIESRYKNGNWQLVATLTSSPGVFNVIPSTPGNAEQIEIRAIFYEKNQPFGNYSPIYTAVIQP